MFLSIVIPVYNVEEYIEECLDSILPLENTKYEYEIIIINDGSPDNSRELIIPYLKCFKNIQLVDKENGGLSSARNLGISLAKGDYILFVDSDDCIFAEELLKMLDIIAVNNVDILRGEYIRSDGNSSPFTHLRTPYASKILDIQSLYTHVLYGENYTWLFIFRRDYILKNNLRYTDELYYEDADFVRKLLMKSGSVMYCNIPFYYYRINPESITLNVSYKHINDLIFIIDQYCRIIESLDNRQTEFYIALKRHVTSLYLMIYGWSITNENLVQYQSEIANRLTPYCRYLISPTSSGEKIKYYWYKLWKYRFSTFQRIILSFLKPE